MPANTSIIPLKAIRTGDQATGDVTALGEFESGDKIGTQWFSVEFTDVSLVGNTTFDTTTMFVDGTNNRVGVGTATPSYDFDVQKNTSATDVISRIRNADTNAASDALLRLQVGGTTQSCYIDFGDSDDANAGYIQYAHSDNSMRFITNAIDNFRMEADGDFHANGDVVAYSTTVSDLRLKEDVQNISDALVKIDQINGVTFVRKNSGEKSAGVIAQEILEVLPEAVKEKQLPLQAGDGEKYYVVEYDAVTGLLVQAIKELNTKVKQLEETIINKS